MGFDQYHEPPEELPPATRTFARLCASLTEEAEAIGWYEQRLAVDEHGETAEADTLESGGAEGEGGYPAGSLGIGSLKGARR